MEKMGEERTFQAILHWQLTSTSLISSTRIFHDILGCVPVIPMSFSSPAMDSWKSFVGVSRNGLNSGQFLGFAGVGKEKLCAHTLPAASWVCLYPIRWQQPLQAHAQL